MADSSKPATPSKGTSLVPQGEHAGKPSMPLGHHQFTLIGSRNRAHLHLLSSTVSRNHAGIIATKSGMYIRDLASRSGVVVNGRKVREVDLQDGDLVQVGSFQFKFQEPSETIHLATTPPPPVAMLEMDGHTLTPIDGRTILIGRRPGCDLTIDSSAVSSTHAIIFEVDNRRFVRDLGSRTGTLVNGTAVSQQVIEVGDVITVGGTKLRYVAADAIGHGEPLADALPLEADADTLAVPAETEPAEVGEEPAIGFDVAEPELAPAPDHALETLPPEIEEPAPIPLDETAEPGEVAHDLDEPKPIPLDFHSTAEPEPEHEHVEQPLTATPAAVEPEQDLGLEFLEPEAGAETRAETPTVHGVEELDFSEPAEVSAEAEPESQRVPEPSESPLASQEEPPRSPEEPAPLPVAEHLAEIETAKAVETEAAIVEAPVEPEPAEVVSEAPAAEPEPVAAEEPPAPVVEEQLEPAAAGEPEQPIVPLLEPQAEESAQEPGAPLRVEDVDLSSVKFGSEPAPEPIVETVEPAPETPAEPAPLLDLVPPVSAAAEAPIAPAATIAAAAAGAVVAGEAVESLTPAKGKRRGRPPKKKADPEIPGRRSRKKKGQEPVEIQSDTTEAAAEPETPEAGLTASETESTEPVVSQTPASEAPASVTAPEPIEVEPEPSPSEPHSSEPVEMEFVTPDLPVREASDEDVFNAPSTGSTSLEPIQIESDVDLKAGHETATSPVETIESTEPTLESALDLDPALQEVHAPENGLAEVVTGDTSLTDTAFGRAVQDFAGSGLGPLIEDAQPDSGTATEASTTFNIATADSTESHSLTSDLVLEQPAEFDSADATVEAGLSGPEPIAEPQLDLEPIPEELAPIAGQDAVDLHAPLPSEELDFSETAESRETPVQEMPALEAAAPAALKVTPEAPSADPSGTAVPAAPAIDPYFGMQRDMGSFIGGMPLKLSPPAAAVPLFAQTPVRADTPNVSDFITQGPVSRTPAAAPQAVPAPAQAAPVAPAPAQPARVEPAPIAAPALVAPTPATEPAAEPHEELASEEIAPEPAQAEAASVEPVAEKAPPAVAPQAEETLEFSDEVHDVPPLDDALFEGEVPLELFDETADKLDALPDSLHPIADVSGALAEPKQAVATAPAPSDTTVTIPAAASSAAPSSPSVAPAPALSSLTADPASLEPLAAAAAVSAVTVPPFAGSRGGARAGVDGFAGLATPKVRATDVFSQTAFPALAESAFRPQPIDIPPMGARGGPSPTEKSKTPDEQKKKTPWRPPGMAPGAPIATGIRSASPPPPPATEESKARRPWWKNIFLLLFLFVALGGGAAAGVIMLLPPQTYVQGVVQLQGADKVDAIARREQVAAVRSLVRSPEVQNVVGENLKNQGIAPGFTRDLVPLADPDNSAFDQSRLFLKQVSTSPDQDSVRMAALLDVLYRENQTPAEHTPKASARVAEIEGQLQALQAQKQASDENARKAIALLNTAGYSGGQDVLQDPGQMVEVLKTKDTQLRAALSAANADVKKKRAALDTAQSASATTAAIDPKVLQLKQKLAGLKAQLVVAQQSVGGGTDPVRSFEDSLQPIERLLTAFLTVNNDPKLGAYLQQAQQATVAIHQLISDQKQDSERIAELRQQIAEHRETLLRQLWGNDETLKQLLEDRDAQSHRYSAAAGSGYTQEATKIQGVLDDLDHRIEARRQTLVDADRNTDDVQQNLLQAIDRLDQSRRQRLDRITHELSLLDVPSPKSLPLTDVNSMTQLGEQVAAAKGAFQSVTASDPQNKADPQATVRKLTADVSETQAELDAYQQRQESGGDVAAARAALLAAQDAEAKAQTDYTKNLSLLSTLSDLKATQSSGDSVDSKLKELQDAQTRAKAERDKVPVIMPPDKASVQVIHEEDRRAVYLAAALGALLLIFAGPIWVSLRESHAEPPMAMLLTEANERAPRRPTKGLATSQVADDEHAAIA